MQQAVGKGLQGGYNQIYEPTMLREIVQADNEFERVLIPEGITTIKELDEKVKGYDSKIVELNEEMKNVKQGERIKERAIEIIRKRAEESISKDNSLKDGDWEKRVEDLLQVFEEDSNEYSDTKEKIEALELTKSIYE